MISEEGINCRRFFLCVGHMDAGDSLMHKNSGSGVVNVALWVSAGGATANGDVVGVGLHDLSKYSGSEILYVSGDSGVDWVAFNPINTASSMRVELFTPGSYTLSPDATQYVVSVAGQIGINSTAVPKFKYARVFPGKTYLVEVPEGACAAVVTV